MPLIIQSKQVLEVGKVYKGFSDFKAKHYPNQPHFVIKESTAEQWIACMLSFGHDEDYAKMLSEIDKHFYEISTD